MGHFPLHLTIPHTKTGPNHEHNVAQINGPIMPSTETSPVGAPKDGRIPRS